MECWNFLNSLGLSLSELSLPLIKTLQLTAPHGQLFETRLPMGGFGISRHLLDSTLANISREIGVDIQEECRVEEVTFNDRFSVRYASFNSSARTITAKVCIGSFGKRSNLDIRWNRKFLQAVRGLDHFVGIKYHVKVAWPDGVIGLHNFRNGYCGISAIENGKHCLCYMTSAAELKKAGNIVQMEKQLLSLNPHLKKIFGSCEVMPGFPVTISQINFNSRTIVENNILMAGDAAGLIAPLCGNGMSMALHSGKLSAQFAHQFLMGKISRSGMETNYSLEWKKLFSTRLKAGRVLQQFFGSVTVSDMFVNTFRMMPFLATPVIRLTHGKPF
jgi:flavin-dependent dehydrogenase